MIPTRCAACKYLRKRCPSDCIFAPYFPSNNPQRFASVHQIFGASNVGKMLKQLPVNQRAKAADCLHFEAQLRVYDPVYGSTGYIYSLQQQVQSTEHQLAEVRAQIALIRVQSETQLQEGTSVGQFHEQVGFFPTSFSNGLQVPPPPLYAHDPLFLDPFVQTP